MKNRNKPFLLILIIAVVTLTVAGMAIALLYRAAFELEKMQLADTARTHARLIEAIARFNTEFSAEDYPQGPEAATLNQVATAYSHTHLNGNSREFIIAERDGNNIVYLFDNHLDGNGLVAPIPADSEMAKPIALALSGESGVLVGPSHQGILMLAAYEPIHETDWALVVMVEIAAVQAPFVGAGVATGIVSVVMIAIGAFLFIRVTTPLIESLEDSEASLRDAQRIARLGSWNWNILTGDLHWSDEIYRIFGLEPQEFGAAYDAFIRSIHPDDRELVQLRVMAAIELDEDYDIVHRVVHPDGTVRYVREQGEVIRDAANKPVRMLGTVIDITDDVHKDKLILRRQQELNGIIEGTTDSVVALDLNHRVIAFNNVFGSNFQLATNKPLERGMHLLDEFAHLPDVYPHERYLWERALTGEIFTTQKIVETPDFHGTYYEVNYSPIKDHNGELIGATQISRDITNQKLVEEALRRSETRLQGILESSPDLIYTMHVPDMQMMFHQEKFNFLDYTRDEFQSTELMKQALHPSYIPKVSENWRAMLQVAEGQLLATEYQIKNKQGGWEWVQARKTVLTRDKNNLPSEILVTLSIITERKQAEERIRQLNESLEQRVIERTAELKMVNEELSQYAYVVSHDLKAPLRAIHNYADFLYEDLNGTLDEEQETYLNNLGRAVRQSEELVEDLLTLSQIGQGEINIQLVRMGRFLHDLVESLALPDDVEVIIPTDWPGIETEPVLLKQIFQNLISNAVKFNRSKHKIVELDWLPVDDNHYELMVRDNGIGIEPHYQEQIFRLFQRLHTKKEYAGTGIGLAIVKKAVSKLQGQVYVESTPNQGSTFTITLPQNQKEMNYVR